ncbi:serine/threonine-protein kinase [Cystobacter ferrugineus]|uniref:serine/threonine-protein kinase n=1 Tax=Cystobacter ferrugineus TaxID=83449 RepID=UPI000A05085A|nr:serine/threonine-protein kinase [Cystobacter ferrugineus]
MSGKKSKARRRQLLSNAVRVENIWEEHSYLVGRCACGGDLVAIRFELVRGPAVTHERCEARCACCLRRHNILFDVSEIFRNGRPLEVQDWYATAWPPVTQGPYARRERELEIKLRRVTEEASFSQLTSEQMQQAIGKVYREHGARLLGRYEVLGARTGAFGQVYLCLDTAADSRMVVCKLAVSSENVDLESIRREASVWLGLGEHPNIVSLYDIKTRTEHQVVLVLEAVHPGPQGRTTLSDWIKAKALREQEKRSILGGVVAGMLYCHERIFGFVHADLKPENILISHGFRAKITDFGLARASAMPGLPLGQGFGTPLYLAPECWDSRPPSEASDVYAFGLLAIETLTGKHPFEQSTDRDALR